MYYIAAKTAIYTPMADYQEHSFSSERASPFWQYVQGTMISLLNKDKNRCILDLGCGNGYLVNFLISHGYNAYGIDASQTGIAIANKVNPGRFFIQDLDDNQLPAEIRDLPFDTIVSTEVIEHIYNPFTFMALCKDVLSKNGGGEIILTTPYHGYLKNLVLSIFDKWDKHTNAVAVGGHIKFWSRASLGKLLTQTGFTVTHFVGCGRMPYMWKSMLMKAKLSS
jgi:2-polyprenyl-3-methyl-5-hydroxy-6-metoxy-1,4-benzoquinol methylase